MGKTSLGVIHSTKGRRIRTLHKISFNDFVTRQNDDVIENTFTAAINNI